MYYLAAALVRPFLLAWLVVAVALVVVWRRPGRRRLVVLSVALGLLLVVCLPITKHFALGSLEWRYPPLDDSQANSPVIVVLGGSLRSSGDAASRYEPGTDTLYRCLRAAELYRTAPRPLLVSGGKVYASDPGPPVAIAMRDFLLLQGVQPEHLIIESASRTTHENAVLSVQLLRERGLDGDIILVTDAAHLRRAEGCFRKQGLNVIPCGCRYRATGDCAFESLVPDPAAAVGVEDAAHEWLGILWYWLTDRI